MDTSGELEQLMALETSLVNLGGHRLGERVAEEDGSWRSVINRARLRSRTGPESILSLHLLTSFFKILFIHS